MGKHDKPESYGVNDRLAHRGDKGWDNPRDDDRTPTQSDTTRLTEQERYGVTYGNHGK